MKLFISLSAFAPNQRVVAKFDANDWATGTVLKVTPKGLEIDFDYGEVMTLQPLLARMPGFRSSRIIPSDEVQVEDMPAPSTTPRKKAKPKKLPEGVAPTTEIVAIDTKRKYTNPLSNAQAKKLIEVTKEYIDRTKLGERLSEYAKSLGVRVGWVERTALSHYQIGTTEFRVAVYPTRTSIRMYAYIPGVDVSDEPAVTTTGAKETPKKAVDDVDCGKLELTRAQFNAKTFKDFYLQMLAIAEEKTKVRNRQPHSNLGPRAPDYGSSPVKPKAPLKATPKAEPVHTRITAALRKVVPQLKLPQTGPGITFSDHGYFWRQKRGYAVRLPAVYDVLRTGVLSFKKTKRIPSHMPDNARADSVVYANKEYVLSIYEYVDPKNDDNNVYSVALRPLPLP